MDILILGRISHEQRTYSLCLEAVAKNKMNIRAVPYKYKTEELFSSIKHFNGILKFTPYQFKTYENCLDAVKRNRYDLKYVPRKYKTVELCLIALSHNNVYSFKYIPKEILKKIELNQTGEN